jgi:hypothetical protein
VKRSTGFFAVAFCVSIPLAGVAQPATDMQQMSQAANGFYRGYESFRPPDGIPGPVVRARFEPYISSVLDKLLVDADAAQAHFSQVTKNLSPPLVEGDLFTPNFEGATSFQVGACTPDARGGRCAVSLVYDNRKDKPSLWSDSVLLQRTNEGWRVDDIVFGGGKGRLTDTLKGAIEAGNGAKE